MKEMQLEQTWLTTKKAAIYLDTTPAGIRNRVYRRQLKPYKPFGKRGRSYFKKIELDRLLSLEPRGGIRGN